MATNEILQFAETDTGTNLLTQAEYLADAQRPIGNQPGVARSKLVNKALRQSSLIAAAVAQFIADNQANNVVDTATPSNIADWIEAAVRSVGIPTAVAGGTADAITVDFTPNVALTNGTTVIVRAGAANATTTPTFAPDGLTAKTIVKGNNLTLVAGDIAGAGHWLEMNFDSVLDKWVLQNPATAIGRAASGANSDITSMTAVTQLTTAAGVAVHGTNTNDSAAAGYVGEYVSSTLTSVTPVSLTNLTIADVTSISLTAGDWDVDGQVSYAFGATTSVTRLRQGASSASATMTNGLDMSVQTTAAQVPTNAIDANLPIPKTRFSLNATTTIYLVAQAEFTVSTCAAYGTIRARRVR